MLKNFKIIVSVLLVTASVFGAVAQTDIYKDVILNGKPAKLNIKTGVIRFDDLKMVQLQASKKVLDSVKTSNTVVPKNLILVASKPDNINKEVQKDIVQATGDTLSGTLIKETAIVVPKKKDSLRVDKFKPTHISEVQNTNFHTVVKDETLYTISKRYQVSLEALKKANNLETALITDGQQLQVKNLEAVNLSSNSFWIVAKGDTLYGIAKQNNTTVASIIAINNFLKPTILEAEPSRYFAGFILT